ncbi:MAG: replication initiator protein [Microviridae sp.]|nr:MAG: replication initiator protein [Microviridae sp.]
MSLACGRCDGCRSERSREWAVRMMHEARYHEVSSFVTFTYRPECIPADLSLDYSDFQGFMRRLRRERMKEWHPPQVLPVTRFFMCGEYGSKKDRPHYHAALFGVDFSGDRKPWKKSGAGFQLYISARLDRLWGRGSCFIGDLSAESAAYMARYTLKKTSLDDPAYESVNRVTGEIFPRKLEFCHMSLKPGIGARWFDEFKSDCFPHDRVVVKGRVQKPPRYYFKRLKQSDPDMHEAIVQDRILAGRARFEDTTVERLAVREVVHKARIAFYKRS